MGKWIVDVISFQKIFGLCDLKGHSGDKEVCHACPRTTDNGRRTECEDRARILEAEFAKYKKLSKQLNTATIMNNMKVGRGRQYVTKL